MKPGRLRSYILIAKSLNQIKSNLMALKNLFKGQQQRLLCQNGLSIEV
jgi:hypothetical protein